MGKNLVIIIVVALFVGLVASSFTVTEVLKSSSKPTSELNNQPKFDVKQYLSSIKDFIIRA